jgi:hypothetical protein
MALDVLRDIWLHEVFWDSALQEFYPLQHAILSNSRTLNSQIGWLALTLDQQLIFTPRSVLQIFPQPNTSKPMECRTSELTKGCDQRSTCTCKWTIEIYSSLREFSTQENVHSNSSGVLDVWILRSVDTFLFAPTAMIRFGL